MLIGGYIGMHKHTHTVVEWITCSTTRALLFNDPKNGVTKVIIVLFMDRKNNSSHTIIFILWAISRLFFSLLNYV